MSGPILNCINSMAHRPPTVVSELALISGIALLRGGNGGLPNRQSPVFLLEAVAQDHRIVKAQRKLQKCW